MASMIGESRGAATPADQEAEGAGEARAIVASSRRALDRYQEVASTESDPLRQIVLLFDGIARFLAQAAVAIEAGDIDTKTERSSRALRIVNYLRARLDLERGGEIARIYDRLYGDAAMRIFRASAALDPQAMRSAAALLAPVREAWAVHAGVDRPVPGVSPDAVRSGATPAAT